MVKHFVLCFVLIASIQGRYTPQQQAPQQYSAPQQPAPAPEQQAPQQYAAPQMQVPQQQAPQQYAAPQMQVPQQQAPQQYAAPQMQVPQQQAPQQYSAPQQPAPAPEQQAPQQYAAPQMQVPQQQAPAYGYQNSQSNPDLSAGVPALPNNCPVGITEPIHEGQVVTETYCRCPSGTYGIDCSENFNNPCGYGSRQYHPADASLGPHYFIECNWNLPYVFKCPADLVWNQEIETCDWAHTYESEPYSSYSAPAQPTYSAPAQPAY